MPRRNQISFEISSVKKLIAVLEADDGAITDSQARKVLKDAHVMVRGCPADC